MREVRVARFRVIRFTLRPCGEMPETRGQIPVAELLDVLPIILLVLLGAPCQNVNDLTHGRERKEMPRGFAVVVFSALHSQTLNFGVYLVGLHTDGIRAPFDVYVISIEGRFLFGDMENYLSSAPY